MKINKFKFIRAIICLVIISITLFKFSGFVFGGCIKNEVKYDIVVVKDGDSLWKIAEEYNKRDDIRNKIKEIQEFNGLKSSKLYKNQTLKVPTE